MNAKLKNCVTALSLIVLSGCAPLQVTCVMPPIPQELDQDPPPKGWFLEQMNSILAPYESLPNSQTK